MPRGGKEGPESRKLAEVTQGEDGRAQGLSYFDTRVAEVLAGVALTALGPRLSKRLM